MAGMKRFVTYIYAYEDKKKGGNSGFARIEIRGEECRIEIHMRRVYRGNASCQIYLFRENAGDIEGLAIGEMKITNGSADFGTILRAGKIGNSSFGIYDMEGIFILSADDQVFMSRWREGEALDVCKERFRVWSESDAQIEEKEGREREGENSQTADMPLEGGEESAAVRSVDTSQSRSNQNVMRRKEKDWAGVVQTRRNQNVMRQTKKNQAEDVQTGDGHLDSGELKEQEGIEQPKSVSENGQNLQQPRVRQQRNTQTLGGGSQNDQIMRRMKMEQRREQSGEQTDAGEEEESISVTEIPMCNIFPHYQWIDIWENLKKEYPVFMPFADRECVCVRLELKDLRELPRRYWYLGNNSFLLHGFFNYRYLVVGMIEKERWIIGVPGIYQHQERVMAAIFGFPEFAPTVIESGGEKGVISDSAGEPINRFGYWYRFIEE